MDLMTKKKTPATPPPPPAPPLDDEVPDEDPKVYPSRKNTRYLAIPLSLHKIIEQYAKDHSKRYDKKSVSWAGRILLLKALTAEGLYPPEESAS